MAILINEFLPNPIGTDSGAEWLELRSTEDQTVLLSGWRLENGSGKKLSLTGQSIAPNQVLKINSPKSFVLKNSGGEVLLYDQSGRVMDRTFFFGVAPEGLSWSRQDIGFAFAQPTPGLENALASFSLPQTVYGEVLGNRTGSWEIITIALCWGLLVGAGVGFVANWYYESKKLLA
ncbi:MAG TPA: lamin tail domain-containing protein [Candidatus Paceibacterota bacterium]